MTNLTRLEKRNNIIKNVITFIPFKTNMACQNLFYYTVCNSRSYEKNLKQIELLEKIIQLLQNRHLFNISTHWTYRDYTRIEIDYKDKTHEIEISLDVDVVLKHVLVESSEEITRDKLRYAKYQVFKNMDDEAQIIFIMNYFYNELDICKKVIEYWEEEVID